MIDFDTLESNMNAAIAEYSAKIKLDSINETRVESLKSLVERINKFKSDSATKPVEHGTQSGKLSMNTEYLALVKESLLAYRDTVVPLLIQQNIDRLKSLFDVAKANQNAVG